MQNNPKTKKIDVNNRTYLAPKVSEYQCLELQLKDSFLNEHEDRRDTHIK